MKLFFLFPVYIAVFLSCASVAGKEIQYVNITDNSKFILLPTEGIEKVMDMAQFLSAEIRGQNYFLNSWVKANENAIEMIFFNEMGASLGELSYSNGLVNFSSAVIPRAVLQFFKPEYIIVDFQLCFYDPVLLDKSLKESGLVLEISNDNRRIFNGNEIIIEIEKTRNTVKLVNHLRSYSYTLEGAFHE
ncbi:MAG: DUF3261 domain-containing protein [Treponema sp.]|nr:DUF3261 domain-containing protein [Treponema sp.]